jgi:hypothetical protein
MGEDFLAAEGSVIPYNERDRKNRTRAARAAFRAEKEPGLVRKEPVRSSSLGQQPLSNPQSRSSKTRPLMSSSPGRLSLVIRILLGLSLVIFGLNAFLNFIPQPKAPLAPAAAAFAGALMATGYMMQLIGLTQLLVGVLLLVNRFVPLALVLFAPFLVNSLAFHFRLEHSGIPMAVIFTALYLYLVWTYRAAYCSLLTARFLP